MSILTPEQPTLGERAMNATQSAHPELWDGLVGAWVPALGFQGDKLINLVRPSTLNLSLYEWRIGQKGNYLHQPEGSDSVQWPSNPFSITVVGRWTELGRFDVGTPGEQHFRMDENNSMLLFDDTGSFVSSQGNVFPKNEFGAITWRVDSTGSVEAFANDKRQGAYPSALGSLSGESVEIKSENGNDHDIYGIYIWGGSKPISTYSVVGDDFLSPFRLRDDTTMIVSMFGQASQAFHPRMITTT